MSFADHDIERFGELFCRLESMYRVRSQHALSFDLFMTAPEQNERWVHIYFANRHLLAHRREGAHVTLLAYLQNGASCVLLGAQLMDEQQRDSIGLVAEHALLPRQRAAGQVFDTMNEYALQEAADNRFERTHTVERRGACYVEAFHDYHPPVKWKTRGVHVA